MVGVLQVQRKGMGEIENEGFGIRIERLGSARYLYGKNTRTVLFPTNNCRDKIVRGKKVDI